MIVFRLCKAQYAKDLSGKGAEKAGGRWNSKGTAIIYTSESRALCTAEIAVHLPLGNLPEGYEIVAIEIPNQIKISEVKESDLADDWREFPHPQSQQKIGDEFVSKEKHAIIKVPSVVVRGDFNYLINPNHKDFKKIKIKSVERFNFDERLFRK